MPLFSGLLNATGQANRHDINQAVHANPIHRGQPAPRPLPPETPPGHPLQPPLPTELPYVPIQQLEDHLQQFAPAPATQVGSAVRTFVGHQEEAVGGFVLDEGRQVTAFIDSYVPIPWFHGEQPVAGRA